VGRGLGESLLDLKAGKAGHHQVKEDAVHRMGDASLEECFAGIKHKGLKAVYAKKAAECRPQTRIVIYDRDEGFVSERFGAHLAPLLTMTLIVGVSYTLCRALHRGSVVAGFVFTAIKICARVQ